MKRIILWPAVFLTVLTVSVQAQDFRGKAVYQSKTSVDMDLEGRNISEQDKKRIMERMKQQMEKSFVLDFSRTTSVYREEEQLEQPGAGTGSGPGMVFFGGPAGGGVYYKDVKAVVYYNQVEMFGKNFLVKDTLPRLNWKLEGETRKIGEYTCYKATTVKTVKMQDFGRFRQRRDNGGDDRQEGDTTGNTAPQTREITITAWYTPEIPVNQGPGEYWGLPGLILEVNTDRTTVLCSKIVMNPGEKSKIEAPKKGKEVSQAEFDEIMRKKTEEMREMYRGQRGNNRTIRIGG